MKVWAWVILLLALGRGVSGVAMVTTPTEQRALAQENDRSAYTLPPDKMAKAVTLSHTRTVLHFVEAGWSLASLWLLLELGAAGWMRDRAVGLSRNRWVQGFGFLVQLMVVTTLLGLPIELYRHQVGLRYGLSVQHWGSWWLDQAKGFGLTLGVGYLGVMLLFWVIGRFPRWWWFVLWVPVMGLVVAGVFVTPYVIDPLFNRFEPLMQSNPALVAELERVVGRGAGIVIAPDRMFLMKASDKVTTLNAYVTGFGASKRVVVWDTSIAKGTPDEIAYIFGHEMGHYVLGHIVLGILFSFALILFSFFVGFHLFRWMLGRYGERWRVTGQGDWAALVVFLLVLSVVGFVLEPLENSFSRAEEHAADVYGQEAVHGIVSDPQGTAQAAFQLLGETSLDNPYPPAWVEFWTYSHPSIGHRAAFAKHYDPWAAGESPKYFRK